MIRVIGLGSPFGEDRAGWLVAEDLRGRVSASVDVVALDRPGAAIINWMRDCRHLILVDAILAPDRHGSYARLSADDLARPSAVSGHSVDLAQSLALAEALGEKPDVIDIYGIYIRNLYDISEVVSNSAKRLSGDLARDIRAIGGGIPGSAMNCR